MDLIEALLSACSQKKLRNIIDTLEIQNVDRRKKKDMRNAILHSKKNKVNELLELFTVLQLEKIHQNSYIPSYHQKKILTDFLSKVKKESSEKKKLLKDDSIHNSDKKKKSQKKREIFIAIDFETADRYRDSACAVAMVRVESGKIVKKVHRLIKPPRKHFEFSYLHGITWSIVSSKPDFKEVWQSLHYMLDGAQFLAAHNASFDRSVLNTCCKEANIKTPSIPFECTVALARKKWNIYPTKLPDVCDYLEIPLNHHDAMSDAVACAEIVLAARINNKIIKSNF